MIQRVCNMCGKPFDYSDEEQDISFHRPIGYGSRFDLSYLNLDLCNQCFDKTMIEYILPNCRHVPINLYFEETDTEAE